MPERVQSLRSSVKGSRPTGRQPGEIYTNFADRQIGVINASNAATDLVAVRYFSAAADYAIGDFVVQAGVMYRAKVAITASAFNVANWDAVATFDAAGGGFVLKAGDTMTGGLTATALASGSTVAAGAGSFVGAPTAAVLGPNTGGTSTGVYLRPTAYNSAVGQVIVTPAGDVSVSGTMTLGSTPAAGDNDTSVATTAFVKSAITAAKTADAFNRLVNPAFQISQENGDTVVPTDEYPADQWAYFNTGITGACARIASGARLPNGSNRCVYVQVTTAKPSLAAADQIGIHQSVEGVRVADLNWGSAYADQVVLRFWLTAPIGTYTVAIRNGALDRSYLAPINVTAAGWQQYSIVIPGDVTGTWASDTTRGLNVAFCFAGGTTSQGVAGWQAGNKIALATATNGAAALGVFYIADVGLYADPSNTGLAPPWQMPDEADELKRCQRYWQSFYGIWNGVGSNGSNFLANHIVPVPPRYGAAASAINGTGTLFPASGTLSLIAGGTAPYNNYTLRDLRTCTGTTYAAMAATYIINGRI